MSVTYSPIHIGIYGQATRKFLLHDLYLEGIARNMGKLAEVKSMKAAYNGALQTIVIVKSGHHSCVQIICGHNNNSQIEFFGEHTCGIFSLA